MAIMFGIIVTISSMTPETTVTIHSEIILN